MKNKHSDPENAGKGADKPSAKKDEHMYDRWKDPEENKMGNDITGDMKIANSNGHLEGGRDKRWHMEDDDQD